MKKVSGAKGPSLKLREKEGLGLSQDRDINDSFMMKVAWDLYNKPGYLEQMQLYRVVVFSEMKQVILWWAFLVIWEWVQFFNQSYEPSSMAFNLLENNRFCK
ncbi:hypothetical protein JHK86_016091 [Glycine max]|nr:hypothetical protein JHK86_016091 [Glycine max]